MCNKQVETVELHHYNNEIITFEKETLWNYMQESFEFDNYKSIEEFLSDYTEDDTDYLFRECEEAVLNMHCPMCEEGYLLRKHTTKAHVYVCCECPFIGFEYEDEKDLQGLNEVMEGNLK